MLAAIGTARESIYLEMYTFHQIARYDFLSELERKALEGVRVIVILDALGSLGFTPVMADRLRRSGAEVLFFSYWFRRTHRKLLIVDEVTAFLGGVNISNHSTLWNDLQLRISGKKVVRHVLRSFARIYRECGGKNPVLKERGRLRLLPKTRLWFIEHGIGKGFALRTYYKEHIDSARSSITLVTPYFIPHRWLISCLHRAMGRGVTVEIIVPRFTDYKTVDRINYYYFDLFTKIGAKCFLVEEMNHAKAMLIDGREGIVGSHNIDALSFNWNVESGFFFEDTPMVADMGRIVAGWKKRSMLFDASQYPPRWYDTIFAILLRFFQPVL